MVGNAMVNLKLALGVAFCIGIQIHGMAKHDVRYTPTIYAAIHADLIVTGYRTPTAESTIPLLVKQVMFKSTGSLVKPGDEIKIINSGMYYYVKGFEPDTLPLPEKELRIFYLKKHDSTYGLISGKQHAKKLIGSTIPFGVCDTTFLIPTPQFGMYITQLKMCFAQNPTSFYEYDELISESDFTQRPEALPQIKYVYQCNDNFRHIRYYEFGYKNPPIPLDTSVLDSNIYPECHERPHFLEGSKTYYRYPRSVVEDTMYIEDELNTGPILVRFVIEPDSQITHIELFRNKSHKYDAFITQKIQEMGKFAPGKINGRPARCYMRSQFYFRRKSEVIKTK